MSLFTYIGSWTLSFFNTMGGLALMMKDAVRWLFRKPFRRSVFVEQMVFIGVQSLPVVILTGLFTGMVFAYQAYFGFSMFGAETMTGTVVALAMARELGPVLSSIMVTARAGSAIAAELGTMRVTEQIDALYALAVEPIQYLVTPRVFAGIVMMPFLNLVAVVCGIFGGYFVSVNVLGINETLYIQNTFNYLSASDILNGTYKAIVFGGVLTLVGCYKGFHTSGGALGVGRATTDAVVLSCVLILVLDYVMTAIMF